ncbi:MAG: ATP-binding cassette domain-containing protein [Betaproteobacteria bacterium]|jgi:ATP-binding cassette subfamily F protein uup|nr:ATP-binding cassette domain-containing protein [Betaproteobacteria bacterium]NBT68529.1 ATP-binding cassette domain-containing protein [Betaproteobacteria bacterium]NBY06582.1 ATP-binding cassette domain-containing protein [Betaproteobacteria bacterium]
MSLITLTNAQLAYGHVPLLDHTDFSLEAQDRVGLIGRNGTGKSSLLKILNSKEKLDDGSIQWMQNLRIATVLQEPYLDDALSIHACVSLGLGDVLKNIGQFESGEGDLDALMSLIESQDGWNASRRVAETLERLRLNGSQMIGHLSGGGRKRVALAQALVSVPDVLLLDEPTNHLDLDSIEWLEDLLIDFKGSTVIVTHDRAFLDRVATRVVELDRGQLRNYPGNFTQYQFLKEDQLAQESVINAKADKLLAQEEVWIRKGVEARRTRSVARIGRLEKLREARTSRRDQVGRVKLNVDKGESSGKLVSELDNVSQTFGDKTVIRHFSATILRGDKVGLIGPNGAGKTTLLKIILGELSPTSGNARLGTNMQIAYFDQMREAIDLDATLEDFISPGSEWIEIGNKRQHVKSYLSDFLFSPARATSPVRSLSGGERNRLLLARLFARPANVLVLDEPTNDLDIDTLELLEDFLQNYDGTVFLVSHDRAFLDQVVTSTIAYEGNAQWREYEGGVQDWLIQSQRAKNWSSNDIAVVPTATAAPSSQQTVTSVEISTHLSKKLSYKEQKELEEFPSQIERLEKEQQEITRALADGSLYVTDHPKATTMTLRSVAIDEELMIALERWEQLGNRR